MEADQMATAREAHRQDRSLERGAELNLRRLRQMGPFSHGYYDARGLLRAKRLVTRVVSRWLPGFVWGGSSCGYCGHEAKTSSRLVVNPITLRRQRFNLCGRQGCMTSLQRWVEAGNAPQRRARWDWENQHPLVDDSMIVDGIAPQYPAVSRDTLRAFLDSGLDSATVASGAAATSLNGSIRVLGFDREVYAEVRSGQATLRRVTDEKETEG